VSPTDKGKEKVDDEIQKENINNLEVKQQRQWAKSSIVGYFVKAFVAIACRSKQTKAYYFDPFAGAGSFWLASEDRKIDGSCVVVVQELLKHTVLKEHPNFQMNVVLIEKKLKVS